MSSIEYNSLLFNISQRLDELNVGRKLLVMCRGRVAPRSEENMQDAFSLLEELEEKGFLAPDRLEALKGILSEEDEWSLFEKVEKFESKRKEYSDLLEQIIRELDELDDLERLIAMCREKIAEDRQGNIHDVRSLFKELENNNCLEFDRLGILKEILTETEKRDLLKEVEEFEQRRIREHKFKRRQAQAAAIVSSVSNKLSGVMNIKTVFKVVAGGITVASSLELLTRGSTYDQLIAAVSTCVLPVGANLIQITEGCVCLTVQARNISALNTLWSLYKDGTLKARLQALFVTDEMRELADGEQVEVIVTIDEREYEKARYELTDEAQEGPGGREEEQLKYLAEDKLSYIQSYLEKAEDTDAHSITTETSDSGMPRSHGAPSEFGMEETSDSSSKLCLKDLSTAVTAELTRRLECDQVSRERFYKSYGLDANKLNPERLRKISEFFPDTPVKVLIDVFEVLQLYDLVELLEKVKPRTLRPALPLKEIGKLSNANNRPTKFFTKAEVLIIDYTASAVDDKAEGIGSFFKAIDSRSEVTTVATKPVTERLVTEIAKLRQHQRREEQEDLHAERREKKLKDRLEPKDTRIIKLIQYDDIATRQTVATKPATKRLVTEMAKLRQRQWREEEEDLHAERREKELKDRLEPKDTRKPRLIRRSIYRDKHGGVQEEDQLAMKKDLEELVKRREQWTKERKPKIEEEIKQKEEELQKEYERFEKALSTVMDKWIQHAQDEGEESTLFVVLAMGDGNYKIGLLEEMIGRCLRENLAFIKNTKLVITSGFITDHFKRNEEIPRETLLVDYCDYSRKGISLPTMLEILEKRWQTLDLISVMLEVQRTVPIKLISQYQLIEGGSSHWPHDAINVKENLYCLPRLQKTEEIQR